MVPDDIVQEARRIADLLRTCQYEYYVLNRPTVSDLEYDRLFDRLKALETDYPEIITPDSPTTRVGSDLESDLPEVEHTIPVLSLDKGYTAGAIESWMEKTAGNAGMKLTFVVEEKIDGVSIVLYYESGLLVRGVTRGNGYVGNDVTENVKTIGAVPLRLAEPVTVAVRGEIYLPLEKFETLNSALEIPYANPRNLAAGTLRRQKSSQVAAVPLEIYIYEGYFQETYPTHLEILGRCRELGFRMNDRTAFFSSDDMGGLSDYLAGSVRDRSTLSYEIDGLVIKVNEITAREALGYTGHHPRWAIAYKFEAPQGVTRVKTVDAQVGRTGRITPVARVEPVKIGGSVISNVTLHNQDYINMLDLAEGDTVAVSRRGDVIPAVEKVLEKNEAGNTTWKLPENCPSCGNRLEAQGAHHFCSNQACPAQVKGAVQFFIGKGQMDIENFGPETVDFLLEKGHIRGIEDLYSFDYDSLIGEPGFGEKKIALIKKGVEASVGKPYHVVLPSLGIPELGKKVTELLIKAGYTSIDALLEAADQKKKEKLVDIHGIGEKTADRILSELANPEIRNRIETLKKAGLNFREKETLSEAGDTSFTGQVWCVTGSFDHFSPREKAMDEVKLRGGRSVGQLSGATTHLLAGRGGGSKLSKARNMGIQVVTEKEFLQMLHRSGEEET